MSTLELDPAMSDAERRRHLLAGRILLLAARPSSLALCARVRSLIDDTFGQRHAPADLDEIPPAALLTKINGLKRSIAVDPDAAALLTAMLADLGCDPSRTFRHRLYLRVVPSSLAPGTGPRPYHAPPHRDVWLASPHCQINWWMPVSEIDADSCLVLYPSFWSRRIANTSDRFDYLTYRRRLAERSQGAAVGMNLLEDFSAPHAIEPVDSDAGLRLVCPVGSILLFSAAHLHASVPNRSGATRFSLDFRTVALDDLISGLRAPPIDTFCSGSSLVDFRRLDDGTPVPETYLALA